MKVKVIFFIKYFASWLVILMLLKFLFIISYFEKFRSIPFVDFLLIFIHGLKLDLSLTAYLVIFPTVILIVLFWTKNQLEFTIIKFYTIVTFMSITLLFAIDLALYNYWQYRLDYTFLNYLDTPGEMLANLRWYQYLILAGILIVSYPICCKLVFNRLYPKVQNLPGKRSWLTAVVFVFILAVLFLPIRGGASTATLNTGSVYFHQSEIVNHAAINPVWNLLYTLTEKEGREYNVEFFDGEQENKILEQINASQGPVKKIINTDRPDIIFIILESFTAYTIERGGGKPGLAPNLNQLIHEGIYFDNFYASGDASAQGLGAIFSGYPALPNTYFIKYESKSENIPGICRDLSDMGYTNRFFYGGDIHFAHINSYLIRNRFEEIISIRDFSVRERTSNWGVPDHIVFNRLLTETNKAKSPFFHVLFTLSSHPPYDVPMDPVFKGSSKDTRFFNSIYYTDKALGDFIQSAKSQSWWDNTLIFILADHGAVYADVSNCDHRRFHIPLLLLGGALTVKDTVISKYGDQTDIAATLLGQMNLNAEKYNFSRNLLESDSLSYAFYTYHKGLGYLDNAGRVVYDLTGMKYIYENGEINDNKRNLLKAYLQYLWYDFANR